VTYSGTCEEKCLALTSSSFSLKLLLLGYGFVPFEHAPEVLLIWNGIADVDGFQKTTCQ